MILKICEDVIFVIIAGHRDELYSFFQGLLRWPVEANRCDRPGQKKNPGLEDKTGYSDSELDCCLDKSQGCPIIR